MSEYRKYLKTLRRLPDDVILSMAARPIDPWAGCECVCGWAGREILARELNADAADNIPLVIPFLTERFGARGEWDAINHAFMYRDQEHALEEAFVVRVLEAVG